MKTNFILFLFSLLIGNVLSAQNWSPLNVDETFYFDSGGADLTGIRVDSVAMVEGDTVWYTNLFAEIHPEIPAESIFCSEPDAETAILEAGFLQFEVIPSEDGVFQFQNPDTFSIHTLAPVGASWVFAETGEETITATVSDIVYTEVLGQPDSVKMIGLSDDRTVQLSQNHGLIAFESTEGDDFSLSGISDRQVGTYPLGRHEIFDFEVGDVFVYYKNYSATSDEYIKTLQRIEITSVTESGDGVINIDFHRASYRRTWELQNFSGNYILVETAPFFGAGTYSVALNIEEAHIADAVPGSYFLAEEMEEENLLWLSSDFGWPGYHKNVYIDTLNSRAVKMIGGSDAFSPALIAAAENFGNDMSAGYPENEVVFQQFFNTQGFNFSSALHIGDTTTMEFSSAYCANISSATAFGEGLGVLSVATYSGLNHSMATMVGYRKGTEEFGYVPDVSEILSVRELSELSEVSVYPVPANDQLRFNAENTDAVTVYDITGKPVYNQSLSGTRHQLDVTFLSSGMYFGHLLKDGQPKARFKFVKK